MLSLIVAVALRPANPQARTLHVFAAASLKEAFTSLSREYERANPGVSVKLNFAGSQTLAAQIQHGARADVFASAALRNLNEVDYDPASLRTFALNRLEIAVRRGLPGIRSVADLAKVRNLVVADPAVPVGRYTEAFFAKAAVVHGKGWLAGVRGRIVSREADVKAVLAKVRLGEADAGIVYVSDVKSAGDAVGRVSIQEALNVTAKYPVAIPTYAENRDDAKGFIHALLESKAQAALERSGFISVTRPVRSLSIWNGMRETKVSLPLATTYPAASVRATNPHTGPKMYRGALAASLPGLKTAKSAMFFGADGYNQTVAVRDLISRRAVLVRHPDGNYQLIVPGSRPSVWVNWLRRIDLR